jgi:hypothetical protein
MATWETDPKTWSRFGGESLEGLETGDGLLTTKEEE